MRLFFILLLIASFLDAGKYNKVKITPEIAYLMVYHKGKAVRVHRIQDIKHRLTGEYNKITRMCPGECIQPINVHTGVQTVGEVEVIDFLKNKVSQNKGLIVDVRPQEFYVRETIPSSVNIPYTLHSNTTVIDKLFTTLGMKKQDDNSWDGSEAIDIMFFCDGLWSDKSSHMIEEFIKRGYPVEKIKYYRGGFQMWKVLGFTTIKSQ